MAFLLFSIIRKIENSLMLWLQEVSNNKINPYYTDIYYTYCAIAPIPLLLLIVSDICGYILSHHFNINIICAFVCYITYFFGISLYLLGSPFLALVGIFLIKRSLTKNDQNKWLYISTLLSILPFLLFWIYLGIVFFTFKQISSSPL